MLGRKFDILKTFDIFNSEAISVIKERIIRFVLVEADNFFTDKSSMSTDINKDDNVQVTIVNNKQLYNLLDNTWRKQQQKLNNENIKC